MKDDREYKEDSFMPYMELFRAEMKLDKKNLLISEQAHLIKDMMAMIDRLNKMNNDEDERQ